jgi:anthranilate synthase component 1
VRGQKPGEAAALVRPIAIGVDAASLYASLCEGGERPDTILLERSTGPTLLLDRAAIRIECRGQIVEATAVGEGGPNLLAWLRLCMSDRVVGTEPGRLRLEFPGIDGVDPAERLVAASPFDVLRALVSAVEIETPEEPFTVAALGVIAFDHVDLLETLPPPAEDPLGFPDFVFWIAESLVVIDAGGRARAICTAFGGDATAQHGAAHRLARLIERCEAAVALDDPELQPAEPDFSQTDLDDAAYEEVVRAMKQEIAAGEVYQIVPSRTFRAACPAPLRAFAALRMRDPSPYHFFLQAGEHLLFGASPETSVRVAAGEQARMVEVKPIAGTRPRGATDDEDDRLEADLRLDGKELAEHMMLVDLARNDVARVSSPGSRRVAKLMTVERYARVMHLVSSVTGALRPGFDAVHALQACLNVGTLTGAPKLRATQLLRGAERTKRGPYGGAIGWLNGAGMLDTAVVIRSAVVRDGTAFVRAGAGVVHDSDPAAEADETRRKASAILSVLAGAAR